MNATYYDFLFQLTGTYATADGIKAAHLGSIRVSGEHKGERIKTMDLDLYGATSLKKFVEWEDAGGDRDKIKEAAANHVKSLLEDHTHTLQLNNHLD